ncbi:MAG TPA: hypothetical protein VKI65_15515 [Gemmataceae bacterium]|nr:hypothetical protein [Gemmataceae bacterium]
MKSTSHRDKARLFTEDSRSAGKFMRPETPPHHGVDSRRADAMQQAHTVQGGVTTPYGRGYARNTSRPELIETYPGQHVPHPIPTHPAHPIGGKGGKNPNMKLGGGGRFAKLKASIAAKGNVRDPGAVAAAIGRAKYGKAKFQALAAKGRKRS